jgi:large subunit ribosomal protein L25
MASKTTKLDVSARTPGSSRETRRLRREGRVPGIIYGGGEDPVGFSVDARELRHALHAAGAVLELSVDGGTGTPVVLKDSQLHPVRGHLMHVDLLRVDLNRPIHAVVAIELLGAEEAPGAKEGGILEHVTREVNIEALPSDIPESIQHDVSGMEMNDTVLLLALAPPAGVTILDDLEATVVATLTPPKLQAEVEEEIEAETELVGEGEGAAEAQAEGATAEEAESAEAGGDESE